MNRSLILILTTCMLLVVFVACQKQLNPAEIIVEEPQSSFPKQIIFSDWEKTVTEVWSIKYDTADRLISIYVDDTTTTSLYDQLKYSYHYNSAGYLIKYVDYFGLEEGARMIVRGQDNRIQYITNHDYFNDNNDTSFYTYNTIGSSLQIIADRKDDFFNRTDYTQRAIFTYSDNLLQSLQYVQDSTEYIYEYSGSVLTSIESVNMKEKTTVLCSYQTENPENSRDKLLELILGKDYYLHDLRDMYFFPLYRLPYVVLFSASAPHLLGETSFSYKDESGELNQNVTFRYTLNEKQLPVEIETHTDNAKYRIRIVY